MKTPTAFDVDRALQKRQETALKIEQAKAERIAQMPKVSGETVEEYLDWLTKNHAVLNPAHLATCMQVAELTVRLQMGKAQNKATQHTLVESGVIEPPPAPR